MSWHVREEGEKKCIHKYTRKQNDLNSTDLHFNDRGEKWTWSLKWTNMQSATPLLRTVPLNQRGGQFSKELTMQERPFVAANTLQSLVSRD